MLSINEFLAYASGFFDGEGNIAIAKSNLIPSIQFTNTDIDVLKEITVFFATVYGIKFKIYGEANEGRKDTYRLRLYGRDSIKKFCELIAPFCITKLKRIKLMLSFLELCPQAHHGRSKPNDDEKKMRMYFCEALAELNKRGKKQL